MRWVQHNSRSNWNAATETWKPGSSKTKLHEKSRISWEKMFGHFMHEAKLWAAHTFTRALTSLEKQFRSTLTEKRCEVCVFCPRWRVTELERTERGQSLPLGELLFSPEDHGKGDSEHPHNRMLMHRDNCDHGSGGGWMGRGGGQQGWCFQCRGEEVRQKTGFGWFGLEEVGASRERTHEVSNSGMMCRGFGTGPEWI